MIELIVNGRSVTFETDPDTPLLWILRDDLGLTGTKFGCGIGACGACTVDLAGAPVRSCVVTASACAGSPVTTVEGLTRDGKRHPLQQAWIDHQVPQCGYCQSGMLMAAAALLRANPNPSDAEIAGAITNICRCGTYPRVLRAIRTVTRAKA